jgi:hypothetical protein
MAATEENQVKQQREMKMLKDNQQRRQQAIEIYKDFIDLMILRKGKKSQYPRALYRLLHHGASVCFKTADDEYEFISKFGRGMWNETCIRYAFNKQDQATLVDLAHAYGAFDY